MLNYPKTPSRHRTRSETAKAPLTPSIRISRLPSLKSKASTGVFDTTNPPSSPVKSLRSGSGGIPVSDSFHRQASGGVIRKGGVESRLDVVTRDYVPPPKAQIRRSKSTPAVNRAGADQRDRFITNREAGTSDLATVASTLESISLNPNPLAAATGVNPPPAASSTDNTLAQQREFAKPLYAQRPGAIANSIGATTNKSRKIATQPERVLDAPGMNAVAVALEAATYIWKADTGNVVPLGEAPEGSNDGNFLGVGLGSGDVELWDVEAGQKLRSMAGHTGQVATLSWNQHILTSGCGDGSIWHHDVRVPRHKVMELVGHSGEVCGLKWRSDGELLASGGNDNVVNIWDGRLGDVGEGARGTAKWTKRNHTAAVKAVAWCPWQPSLLASGGGTNDATIHVWNSTTGARLHTLKTPSQITSIQWAPHRKEILTTHGYPTNSIMLHAYPSMERVAEIRDAHESRVLFSCVGPAGDMVCTGAGDENLKFWRIWEVPGENSGKKRKGTGVGEEVGRNTTKEGILSLR
ncbi:WD40-repeat-containing domain protein [Cyathus striatus]|nr:WD40-repeat-containing domain protein [Cyathus striatus]